MTFIVVGGWCFFLFCWFVCLFLILQNTRKQHSEVALLSRETLIKELIILHLNTKQLSNFI